MDLYGFSINTLRRYYRPVIVEAYNGSLLGRWMY